MDSLMSLVVAGILLLPLSAFLVNGLLFRKNKSTAVAGSIASLACFGAFLLSCFAFSQVLGHPQLYFKVTFWQWLQIDDYSVPVSFLVDLLSSAMLLVVTGVGFLIHVFSIRYMDEDKAPSRYFAYLSLFIFNMLVLVLADNLLVMFVGWEGVGLCSLLLIGFWFTDPAKAQAGFKAFIMNRIGDAGFLLGFFLLFLIIGSVSFSELPLLSSELPSSALLTFALLALFVGATGKSAQIPLHAWLPDAMAGPTPVSALIHAATMVTAGVYLFIRLSPILVLSEVAMGVIAWTGALTALVAAGLACVQNDIKKILAYSTVSQLGYMFLAIGVGSFLSAFFHLFTHAFFKALMFLGAGAIIYALHHEQDIRKMGGLKKYLPVVHITFLTGWLAIIGIPPFSGAFSKDAVLWYAATSSYGSWSLWGVGVVVAMMTAYYMTRLMIKTFWGEYRGSHKPTEKSLGVLALAPLVILALLSTVAGLIGLPHMIAHLIHVPVVIEEASKMYLPWLPLIEVSASQAMEWILMGVAVAFSLRGVYIAFLAAKFDHSILPQKLQRVLDNKYYVDFFYEKFLAARFVTLSKNIWFYIEANFIDEATYVISRFVLRLSKAFSYIQNGHVQNYIFYMSLGVMILITYVFMVG